MSLHKRRNSGISKVRIQHYFQNSLQKVMTFTLRLQPFCSPFYNVKGAWPLLHSFPLSLIQPSLSRVSHCLGIPVPQTQSIYPTYRPMSGIYCTRAGSCTSTDSHSL